MEAGGVVVVVVLVAGRGKRILTCPVVESFFTVFPVESMRLMAEAEEIPGASR